MWPWWQAPGWNIIIHLHGLCASWWALCRWAQSWSCFEEKIFAISAASPSFFVFFVISKICFSNEICHKTKFALLHFLQSWRSVKSTKSQLYCKHHITFRLFKPSVTKQKRPCEEKLANPTGLGRCPPTIKSGSAWGFCLLKDQDSKSGNCHEITFTMNCCYINWGKRVGVLEWKREQTFRRMFFCYSTYS